jgi:sulfite reductase (ferredoxin)
LRDFYEKLASAGLANPGALTIASAVGCSGTTSCNLAITNSHRLAKEVQRRFLELGLDTDDSLREATIKISGCPNSCGQHEIATIGFFGGATRMNNSMTPTYTMLFGGSAGEQGELGKAAMRVPAKRVIDTILKVVELYRQQKSENETLHQWITKVTKGQGIAGIKNLEDMKAALAQMIQLPTPEREPDAYRDYGSDSQFSAKTAKGECAA